jgi:hypothetical protein
MSVIRTFLTALLALAVAAPPALAAGFHDCAMKERTMAGRDCCCEGMNTPSHHEGEDIVRPEPDEPRSDCCEILEEGSARLDAVLLEGGATVENLPAPAVTVTAHLAHLAPSKIVSSRRPATADRPPGPRPDFVVLHASFLI